MFRLLAPTLRQVAPRARVAPRIALPRASVRWNSDIPGNKDGKAKDEVDAKEAENEAKDELPREQDLPDLTQGIPTEWNPTKPKGELPESAYVSSSDRKREAVAKYTGFAMLAALFGGVLFLGRNWDEEEIESHYDAPNGWSPLSWWARASARVTGTLSYYQEPTFEKLLPKLDPMLEKPYTLCISLEDMLVHSEWTREHGWRLAKRPGLDYFLRYLSQYYELVLFTTVPSMNGLPIMQKLDPFQIIMFPLFREATKYEDGALVKDLSYLNRDLSKVIILDTDPSHVRKQPENAIILPKWTGQKDDKDLIALIPFLEYIHTMQYKDTRKVLKSFEGKHIPTEFARREAIARAAFEKEYAAKHKRKSSVASGLSSFLGLRPSNMNVMVTEGDVNPAEAFAQGKMLQDIARERGRRYYEILEKDLRENGERYLKEQAEAQEKMQKEAMNNMMGGLSGMFVEK